MIYALLVYLCTFCLLLTCLIFISFRCQGYYFIYYSKYVLTLTPLGKTDLFRFVIVNNNLDFEINACNAFFEINLNIVRLILFVCKYIC